MIIRRVSALLLVNALLAVPLCALGCTPTQLTVAIDRGPVQEFQCHGSSGSAVPEKHIPDSSPKPNAPCTHCAHLLDAIKRGDSSLLLTLITLTVSHYLDLSQTSLPLQHALDLRQRSPLDNSSPPRLTSALRI